MGKSAVRGSNGVMARSILANFGLILASVNVIHGVVLGRDMTWIATQGVGAALLARVSLLSIRPAEVEEWPLGNVFWWPMVSQMQESLWAGTKVSRLFCTVVMLCSAGFGVVGLSQGLIEKNDILWKIFIGCTCVCELYNILMGSGSKA